MNRLTAAANPNFSHIIDQLAAPLTLLQTQLGNVDTSVTQQRGATHTNDQVIADFKETMRTQEGVIANAVGGFNSAGYLQFYPHGFGEYTTATKTQMPVLVSRVKTAATGFATQLGAPLTTTLQNFETAWQNSRTAQQQQMGTVGDNRMGRTTAETNVQLALIFAVHNIGAIFPGDAAQCSSYFDFSLLFPQAHPHKAVIYNGHIANNAVAVALNRSFTDAVQLKLTTVANNASLLVYLGAAADAQPNGKGVEVAATHSRNLKLSELGDEADTFLLIKNMSDVNEASYMLEVRG
ncbi:MAG: hypothetical protein ABJB05_17560 [Parafilimonas sp.]